MISQTITVLFAWILDAVFGDPEKMPHPVRIIGSLIQLTEKWTRKAFTNKKMAGALTGLLVTGISFFVTFIIINFAASINLMIGAAVSIIIIFTCLSTRSLSNEAQEIMSSLNSGDVEAARLKLAGIVGRDVDGLDQEQIIRATVETVSENTVDGIISPLFYVFIGGAPLAMAFKAVNTLDSMIGYKNKKYIEFGWFSARLDDVANFIPARLSLVLIAFACLFLYPSRVLNVIRTGISDGRNSTSPNSGYPEACFAAAIGIQLGGESSYNGVVLKKPLIGENNCENEPEDISKAIRLMWFSSVSTLSVFAGLSIVFRVVI